ncbi:hypothetical protein [Paraburkholderia sp. J8-2]|uniref:hypothetical protein n=1 Tax=Paraburkholderia sp. J8-2 TaxID=2805440 RepID=UPI002AB7B192|nr:hypothetical protein [Paraburkholderia sp. J8-2]
MSDGFTFSESGANDDIGFTVRYIGGCRIVYGGVPISDVEMLAQGFSDKAVMSMDLCDLLGATFVIGEPDAIAALRSQDNLPIAAKRRAEASEASNLGLHEEVSNWLLKGERGASSNAICKAMFGLPSTAAPRHPRDPDELRRCLLFLDAARTHDRIEVMREVSPEWARLVARWGEITTLFNEECAAGPLAPRTYALMQEILAPGGASAPT